MMFEDCLKIQCELSENLYNNCSQSENLMETLKIDVMMGNSLNIEWKLSENVCKVRE